MSKIMLKFVCGLCLTLVLVLATAPAAGAISYYTYLQQYLSQQVQQPVPPQPEPEQPTQPAPANPLPSQTSNDFWVTRAASRNALLNNPQQPASAPSPTPQPQPVPQPQPIPVPQPTQLTAREAQMLDLVNRDRRAYGLKPLEIDMRLTRLARLKSQDIVNNNYFAHVSPTYGTAFDMFRANNISFLRGGENLSKAGNVIVSQMRLLNSPNHRANLLTPQYTHIGIGIVDNNPSGIVATQMFIQKP